MKVIINILLLPLIPIAFVFGLLLGLLRLAIKIRWSLVVMLFLLILARYLKVI